MPRQKCGIVLLSRVFLGPGRRTIMGFSGVALLYFFSFIQQQTQPRFMGKHYAITYYQKNDLHSYFCHIGFSHLHKNRKKYDTLQVKPHS